MPHHHACQALPLDEAVALVARVCASAEHCARLALAALANEGPARVTGIALRVRQPLPPTVAERIKDYRAQNVADWVMYREALALAAEERGWAVHWYDVKTVFGSASKALNVKDIEAHFAEVRRTIGPPWIKDHKLAMAAAIVAARSR